MNDQIRKGERRMAEELHASPEGSTMNSSSALAVQPARNERLERFTHATPTVEDVARHAGVSRQTVSNVLNAPDRVRPDTIDRVKASIDTLGYRANRNARNLRTRTSHAIAYRIPPIAGHLNSVMDTFLHELTEAVEAIGCHVLLFTSSDIDDEIDTYWELAAQAAADGIVFSGTERNDRRPAGLLKSRTPFVSFGRTWGTDEHSWVDVDGQAGTRLAIEHLLAQGHRRFAWLGSDGASVVNDERERGVREALKSSGVPAADLHVVHLVDDSARDRRCISDLLDGPNAPTAFVSMSDLQALTVLAELETRGLVPGRDTAVIGFDDSPVAAYAGGGLTTIRQPITTVAREIARLLAAQLADPTSPPEGVLLQPELIVRRTG
jgi:DNA-binding LacI/PurR family transcriptional regulator